MGTQPSAFPDPLTINPRRPATSYEPQTYGLEGELGQWFFDHVVPAAVRAVFRLKNLRRAEGVAGRLASVAVSVPVSGVDERAYLDETGNVSFWPGNLTVVVRFFFSNRLCLIGKADVWCILQYD